MDLRPVAKLKKSINKPKFKTFFMAHDKFETIFDICPSKCGVSMSS